MYQTGSWNGVYSSPVMQSALRLYMPRQEETLWVIHPKQPSQEELQEKNGVSGQK